MAIPSSNSQTIDLILVVPCYNEAHRLDKKRFKQFLNSNPNCALIFVDDGSTDRTGVMLKKWVTQNKLSIKVLVQNQNEGKAEAVRVGMLEALKLNPKKIGFLDADLSISSEECFRLSKYINASILFVFGSRIKKIDNTIERKWYRFFIGRVIATIISKMLSLPVYDTQCGGKVFDASIVCMLFERCFISRWLFDVELFFRAMNGLGKEEFRQKSMEIPVEQWIDTPDSKVPFSYAFSLWFDLIKIYKEYR